MNKALKLLSRVFRTNGHAQLSALIATELDKPMFMLPGEAKRYTDAFLQENNTMYGAVNAMQDTEHSQSSSVEVTIIPEIRTAIMAIQGPLFAKEIEVPCAAPPTSYTAIKFEMTKLMDNSEIDIIIGEFDSGGGTVSRLVDLSDFIYSLRGQGKRLIASVNDKAYSAAYGVASAFDEIWVSRTSGVGSIGIVSEFTDHSKANEMKGISTEYLYAGDKKVFGNPNEPLSDEARVEWMADIAHHYEMLTTAVARNLGVTTESVVATQAGTYTGVKAVEAGLAHTLGSLDELISTIQQDFIMSTETDRATLVASIQAQEAALAVDKEALASLPEVAPSLVPAATAPVATAPAATAPAASEETGEVARVAGIRAVCAAAGKEELAENFITSKMTIATVQSSLSAATSNSDAGDGISNAVTLAESENKAKSQASADAGWDETLGNKT